MSDNVNNNCRSVTTIQSQIDVINGKLNGTILRENNETDEYLRNQLIIYTSQLDSGKRRLTDLRKTLDSIRKELGGVNSLMSFLGLKNLGFMNKLMIIAVIILVIWLLKG